MHLISLSIGSWLLLSTLIGLGLATRVIGSNTSSPKYLAHLRSANCGFMDDPRNGLARSNLEPFLGGLQPYINKRENTSNEQDQRQMIKSSFACLGAKIDDDMLLIMADCLRNPYDGLSVAVGLELRDDWIYESDPHIDRFMLRRCLLLRPGFGIGDKIGLILVDNMNHYDGFACLPSGQFNMFGLQSEVATFVWERPLAAGYEGKLNQVNLTIISQDVSSRLLVANIKLTSNQRVIKGSPVFAIVNRRVELIAYILDHWNGRRNMVILMNLFQLRQMLDEFIDLCNSGPW